MHDENEEMEDGFQISDDENVDDLEAVNDFGLDEDDPDKDR
jgi:hypothetical protein